MNAASDTVPAVRVTGHAAMITGQPQYDVIGMQCNTCWTAHSGPPEAHVAELRQINVWRLRMSLCGMENVFEIITVDGVLLRLQTKSTTITCVRVPDVNVFDRAIQLQITDKWCTKDNKQ